MTDKVAGDRHRMGVKLLLPRTRVPSLLVRDAPLEPGALEDPDSPHGQQNLGPHPARP